MVNITTSHPYSASQALPRKGEALGQSEIFLAFQERLSAVAPIDRPILLIGERGTGKELAAERLHYLSKRWQGPLIALDCAALTPSLIESELFGYEKGAFTGAAQRRSGRFEAADEGSLFLDEAANIPMEVQEKILRVVEYGTFERVGSSTPIEVDVRIIAATNADLRRRVRQGRFKPDLLDRLSFEVLLLPPLRERLGDILLLADHFAARMAFELGRSEIPRFSRSARAALGAYPWPGNIRELKNVVERAVYRTSEPRITEILFDPFEGASLAAPPATTKSDVPERHRDTPPGSLKAAVQRLEIRMLRSALEQTRYNQRAAAHALGLTYHQFRGLYRKHREDLD